MKRRILALILNCLLLISLCTEAYADKTAKQLTFTTVTLDGEEVSSKELFQNHVITVVNVWASWCKPCIEEMEKLSKLYTRLQKLGCGVVGILWDGDTAKEEGLAIVEEKKLSYPTLMPCEEMGELTEITVFPTTFFVDSEGRLVGEVITGAKVEQYEQTVQALMDKKMIDSTPSAKETVQTDGNGSSPKNQAEKTDNRQADVQVPDGMKLVCDGDSCYLIPADEPANTDPQPIKPNTPAEDPGSEENPDAGTKSERNPQPAPDEEPQPEPTQSGSTCPILIRCVSETEVIAWAAGEYAGIDGTDLNEYYEGMKG